MSLISMVRGLNEAGVRFVVIGGLASAAHGSSRITDDLDVCYDTAPDNLAALASLLASWDAYFRDVEEGLPIVIDVRMLRTTPVMTLRTSRGHLDVFDRVQGVGDYAACLASAEWVTLAETRFAVLGLPALIAAKQAAGRPKDLAHLPELKSLLELKQTGG